MKNLAVRKLIPQRYKKKKRNILWNNTDYREIRHAQDKPPSLLMNTLCRVVNNIYQSIELLIAVFIFCRKILLSQISISRNTIFHHARIMYSNKKKEISPKTGRFAVRKKNFGNHVRHSAYKGRKALEPRGFEYPRTNAKGEYESDISR